MPAVAKRQPTLLSPFGASVMEPGTSRISPQRFAERLRISQSTLEIVGIISTAARLTGDTEKAFYWFRNEPICDYNDKTAEELVTEGHARAVKMYLDDLENGATG